MTVTMLPIPKDRPGHELVSGLVKSKAVVYEGYNEIYDGFMLKCGYDRWILKVYRRTVGCGVHAKYLVTLYHYNLFNLTNGGSDYHVQFTKEVNCYFLNKYMQTHRYNQKWSAKQMDPVGYLLKQAGCRSN